MAGPRLRPHRRLGICLAPGGAVLAMVGMDPPRLVAVTQVIWPADTWLETTAARDAMRIAHLELREARRRFALPAWREVTVVVSESLDEPAALLPVDVHRRAAELLARAGFTSGHAVDREGALGAWRENGSPEPPRGASSAAAREEALLAAGAALVDDRHIWRRRVADDERREPIVPDGGGWVVSPVPVSTAPARPDQPVTM